MYLGLCSWKKIGNIGPIVPGNERSVIHRFLQAHKDGFAFSLKDLGSLKDHEIWIEFANDTPIFWQPYKYNDKERSLTQARTQELLEARLVELLVGKYALINMILAKNYVFDN
jgi:hypothetical protein